VSIVGVVDVLRGKPHNPVGPDGRMALSDHFRELRARLMRSALVLVIAFCVAIFFYTQLLEVVQHPYNEARTALANRNPPIKTEPVVNGAGGGILLQFKLCGVVSLIAAARRSTPGCSPPSRGRCSWGAWRWATTCCPRV
jgi:sec-independent protein translocase protein TatC